LQVTPEGLLVQEMVAGLSPGELQELTGARLHFTADVQVLSPG